jgi:adenylate kinase family enzyme
MKILIGSHGVGKSTLLKEVSEKYPEYYVTDGFSRPVYRIAKELDFSEHEKQIVINELSTWAYQNYLTHKSVISTRSIIDCIIYTQILNPSIDVSEMIKLFQETKNQVEKFFYIPIEFSYVYDPERLNEDLQKKIDLLFREFMVNYIPKDKVIILKGTVEQRLELISQHL